MSEGLFSMKTLDNNGKVLQEEIFFNDGSKRVIKTCQDYFPTLCSFKGFARDRK